MTIAVCCDCGCAVSNVRIGGARAVRVRRCVDCKVKLSKQRAKNREQSTEDSYTAAIDKLFKLLDECKPRILPEAWDFVD